MTQCEKIFPTMSIIISHVLFEKKKIKKKKEEKIHLRKYTSASQPKGLKKNSYKRGYRSCWNM